MALCHQTDCLYHIRSIILNARIDIPSIVSAGALFLFLSYSNLPLHCVSFPLIQSLHLQSAIRSEMWKPFGKWFTLILFCFL